MDINTLYLILRDNTSHSREVYCFWIPFVWAMKPNLPHEDRQNEVLLKEIMLDTSLWTSNITLCTLKNLSKYQ